jgi:Transmembrane amino acid transporter protein
MVRCIATACCLAAAVLQVQAAAPTAPSGLYPARRAALTLRGGRARAVLTEAKIDELRTQGPPLVPAHGTCDSSIAEHAVPEGEMSLGTGILNLVADLCPHGMLPVAFGMAAAGGTGVLAAPALLAVFGATSAYTLISLGRASERTGQYSFSGLWANLIGRDTAWIIEVAFAVMTFGCCVFYSAFIGDLFASLANTVSWVPALLQRRAVTLTALSVFPLLPLCLMKNLSALQPTSFGGLVSILYTVWFVVKRAVDGSYAVGGQFFDAIDTKVCAVLTPHSLSSNNYQNLLRYHAMPTTASSAHAL